MSQRQDLYWIIGGSCTGKSTISRAIAKAKDIVVYDMDEHIFGSYMSVYTEERHPASVAWFSAPNSLEWVLSLSWEEFDALNKAANAEYLDLLADDLDRLDQKQALLIDGGITYPSLLVRALPPDRIFCIDAPEDDRVRCWEASETRASMKRWILELPVGDLMWQKFLRFDSLINDTITRESRDNNITVFLRGANLPATELVETILEHFGL